MPRPPIAEIWVTRIKRLAAEEGLTANAIARCLDTDHERGRAGRTDNPHRTTIQRVLDNFPDEERAQWRFVRWPETFERELLPWEAAAVLLDLRGQLGRFTVRFGRWYWRASLAAPDAPPWVHQCIASAMAAREAGGADYEDYEAEARSIEFYIALKGWQDTEAYRASLASFESPPAEFRTDPPSIRLGGPDTPESVQGARLAESLRGFVTPDQATAQIRAMRANGERAASK
jgi:hypothetical protein